MVVIECVVVIGIARVDAMRADGGGGGGGASISRLRFGEVASNRDAMPPLCCRVGVVGRFFTACILSNRFAAVGWRV